MYSNEYANLCYQPLPLAASCFLNDIFVQTYTSQDSSCLLRLHTRGQLSPVKPAVDDYCVGGWLLPLRPRSILFPHHTNKVNTTVTLHGPIPKLRRCACEGGGRAPCISDMFLPRPRIPFVRYVSSRIHLSIQQMVVSIGGAVFVGLVCRPCVWTPDGTTRISLFRRSR